jgi:hypothetical protein
MPLDGEDSPAIRSPPFLWLRRDDRIPSLPQQHLLEANMHDSLPVNAAVFIR